jgi:hypothetical protein
MAGRFRWPLNWLGSDGTSSETIPSWGEQRMSDNEIIQEFLIESAENLDRLDRDLVELEKDPKDRDSLAGVFRTIHTIKGACGFLKF